MTIRTILSTAALALTLSGTAHAQGLKPIQSQRIDLGQVAGDAYYTVDHDGYRVVATFAERGGATTPVRFEAVLAPGQTVKFSAPRAPGQPADAVEISRQNDQVLVHTAASID
jgi:hypothetical protein